MGKVKPFPKKIVENSIRYPKRIVIDEVKGTRITGEVTFTVLLDMCLNTIVANAFHVVELSVLDRKNDMDENPVKDPAEVIVAKLNTMRKACTEHLFDQMNAAFTKALCMFAPDIVQHPGLTELAIRKAEDEIITAYLDSLPEEEREAAVAKANDMLAQSRRKLLAQIEENNKQTTVFEPLTEDQTKALEIFNRCDADEDSVTQEEMDWARGVSFPMRPNPDLLQLPGLEPAEGAGMTMGQLLQGLE